MWVLACTDCDIASVSQSWDMRRWEGAWDWPLSQAECQLGRWALTLDGQSMHLCEKGGLKLSFVEAGKKNQCSITGYTFLISFAWQSEANSVQAKTEPQE